MGAAANPRGHGRRTADRGAGVSPDGLGSVFDSWCPVTGTASRSAAADSPDDDGPGQRAVVGLEIITSSGLPARHRRSNARSADPRAPTLMNPWLSQPWHGLPAAGGPRCTRRWTLMPPLTAARGRLRTVVFVPDARIMMAKRFG